MPLLRFTTAGSVDDGKSTLIGRLLYDSRGVYEDQLAAARDSKVNRSGGPLDLSLLTDGLRAEREQGITIDVAYRYFATPARKFIIADTPGHEQYTRNMVTGASTADLAIILIDARHGVLPQSRRHACIASLLGIPQVVAAVNKMDLVDYSKSRFEEIRESFGGHLGALGFQGASFIPISALEGDNVVARSGRTPWYEGPSLLGHLETVRVGEDRSARPLRFPVQYVIRPDQSFRGYAGQLISGSLQPGDAVLALPSGRATRVRAIPAWNGGLREAFPPMSIAVQLEHEIDVSRGDMLVDPSYPPHVTRRFDAQIVWMHERPLETGRTYLLKHTTQQVTATVTALRYRIDVNTLEQSPARCLELNEIGGASVETSRPLFLDPYRVNSGTGSFILIDPILNATVGAGMIEDPGPQLATRTPLAEVEFRISRVTPAERFARAGHYPAVIWLDARSDLAYLVEAVLFARGCLTRVVAGTGDTLPELAELLTTTGLISIFSAPGDSASERERARALVGAERFLEPAPDTLAPSDEDAVRQILEELERRGILTGQFTEGGGI